MGKPKAGLSVFTVTTFKPVHFDVHAGINNNVVDGKGSWWWRTGVNVTFVLKRQSSYYTTTFVLPTVLIVALTLCGLFIPSHNRLERTEKCTMGLTGM